jgi:hypothetical protein
MGCDNLQGWADIAAALDRFGWDDAKLRCFIAWALRHTFWKNRIVGFDSLAKAMLNCIAGDVGEKGVMPQYERHLSNLRGGAVASNLPRYRRESGRRDILGKGDI